MFIQVTYGDESEPERLIINANHIVSVYDSPNSDGSAIICCSGGIFGNGTSAVRAHQPVNDILSAIMKATKGGIFDAY